MKSIMPAGQLSSLMVLVIVTLMAASWSCSSGAELVNDLVEPSRHHLPYDSYQGDTRESNWDDSALSEEKRARSQAWRIPPSDWVNKRYMRFGRSSTDDIEDVDAAYPNEDEKRYMRFGKRYMRFGRKFGRGREIY